MSKLCKEESADLKISIPRGKAKENKANLHMKFWHHKIQSSMKQKTMIWDVWLVS